MNWLLAPAGSFFIAGLIIIISGYAASYWLLFFPFVISTLLTTYKSQKNNHILGYCGTVDLSGYTRKENHDHEKRIEPTFNSDGAEHSQSSTYQDESNSFVQRRQISKDSDIGEAIRLKLFNNKNAVLTITILTLLVIMAMSLTSITSSSNKDESTTQPNPEISTTTKSTSGFLHEVTLPDNFSLFVSPFNGITIKWEGDATNTDILWEQLTAQGDKSCMAITYNNGENVRTLNVIKENSGDYLANFSPLDTKVLIKNIANRSRFTLCGYEFSLKGSQSVLGKHSYYSKFTTN
jgi:hypothetical protein